MRTAVAAGLRLGRRGTKTRVATMNAGHWATPHTAWTKCSRLWRGRAGSLRVVLLGNAEIVGLQAEQ